MEDLRWTEGGAYSFSVSSDNQVARNRQSICENSGRVVDILYTLKYVPGRGGRTYHRRNLKSKEKFG